MRDRIAQIPDERVVPEAYIDYFSKVSDFILKMCDILDMVADGSLYNKDISALEKLNADMYKDVVGDAYNTSYANYDYAFEKLNNEKTSRLLCFLYNEIRGMTVYAYEGRILDMTLFMELFVQIYFMVQEGASDKEIEQAVYYFEHDYAELFMTERVASQLDPHLSFAADIVMESDLQDLRYLYFYGEYIGRNELETARFLNSMSQEEIDSMARTYTEGYRQGFVAAGIDLSQKKTVNIRYFLGQERMIKAAIEQFKEMGLLPVLYRYSVNRINRRLMARPGYSSTVPNKQLEYDHRMDEALFLDKKLVERKLEILKVAYKKYEREAATYGGPAVVEVFGEMPFQPENKERSPRLDEKQQKLSLEYQTEASMIVNEYIPQDKYSFTIIAYPVPEIGDNFPEIFADTVKINTMDNELFRKIHQSIIDELDTAQYVRVIGQGKNVTDMKVNLCTLKAPEKETKFENCVADVNIPVGEVFTSPKLTGTFGTLNVSEVYLGDLKYVNLKITFKDGMIDTYTCDNYDSEEENAAYIKQNLLGGRDTLPIGEFAIGTNTTAYVIANKYDIVYKLPILIVEKMGPHFAVGDTCYSRSEEVVLRNPDGKEIVAKENECSLQRDTNPEKAYFNCHTDITIPYDEIGGIYSVHPDGTQTAIIEKGRFVLPGTEILNKPFEQV
jgi:leucyl aminopeptidase (aminopeptidase T)